jgi:ParB family chromosome partitioning protein
MIAISIEKLTKRFGQVVALKARGFNSPYLRNFVVARIRPFRPRGKPAPDADALLEHMAEKAAAFDVGKVKESQVSKAAGGGDD